MHCLMWRTKSPPVISSSSSTSASDSPDAHSYAYGVNPGSGHPGLGQPGVVFVGLQVACDLVDGATAHRHRLGRPPRGWHRAVALGPAALEREARHQGRELRCAQPVEQAFPERLGEQEIGLGVHPCESFPRVGERPTVDVPPRLEHAQHPVEMAGQAVVAPADPTLEALQITFESGDRPGDPKA